YKNREHFEQYVEISEEVPTVISDLLFDPQTSGGLLMAVPAEKSQQLLEGLHSLSVTASPVGRVLSCGQGKILVKGT
ncbi:MAG: selenide, water dikinase SelD, partial [Thermacetogeniaceae bacterium]